MIMQQVMQSLQIDLFEALELGLMDAEKKKLLLDKLEGLVFDRLLLKILERFSTEDSKALESLMKDNEVPESKILDFIQERIPNFHEFILQEIALFKTELIQRVKTQMSEEAVLAEVAEKNES